MSFNVRLVTFYCLVVDPPNQDELMAENIEDAVLDPDAAVLLELLDDK